MGDKNMLFSEIRKSWKDEYTLMNGLRKMDQPVKILGIFQRFWELLLFLILAGTTVPLVFVNAVVESDATIFIVILMQAALVIAALSYIKEKNEAIIVEERDDNVCRYLLNTMVSAQELDILDFEA